MSYFNDSVDIIQRSSRKNPMSMPKAHYHDRHEIYYLEKGKTKYFIGSEIFLLKPGDMIFVPKGTFHKTDSQNMEYVERVLIMVDDDILKDCPEFIEDLSEKKLLSFTSEQMHKITDIIHSIENEEKLKLPRYRFMQKLYLEQLIITASRMKLAAPSSEITEPYKIIQSAAEYICSNPASDLSLRTLSHKFGMCPSYFSKQFKKITGIGLNEYINLMRINTAAKLLESTHLSVTDIALECGFNDSNYFAAVFKKIKGIAPKKFSMQFRDVDM